LYLDFSQLSYTRYRIENKSVNVGCIVGVVKMSRLKGSEGSLDHFLGECQSDQRYLQSTLTLMRLETVGGTPLEAMHR